MSNRLLNVKEEKLLQYFMEEILKLYLMYHKGILKDLAIKLIRNSKEKITKINNIKK